jgi:hypothetical protein
MPLRKMPLKRKIVRDDPIDAYPGNMMVLPEDWVLP